jgi:hypothetical protein
MTSIAFKPQIDPDLTYPVMIMYGTHCMTIRELPGSYLLSEDNPQRFQYVSTQPMHGAGWGVEKTGHNMIREMQ